MSSSRLPLVGLTGYQHRNRPGVFETKEVRYVVSLAEIE
jgi:hypothetical protein